VDCAFVGEDFGCSLRLVWRVSDVFGMHCEILSLNIRGVD
jgi:hypothetical protein